MSRLRKIAKNLKGQPRLKKMLAEWLTNCEMTNHHHDLKDMILNGRRGFLAMHEKELTNLFDKKYAELEAKRDVLIEEMKEYESKKHTEWELDHTISQIKKIEISLIGANRVYNEIFEEVFL